MNRNPLILSLAMSALLGSGLASGHGRYRPRVLTLEEEEERSVQRMVARARARRRATERERRRAEEAEQARIAAEKEAARPKSRQELRAKARDLPSTWEARQATKSKPQSESLRRMLRKARK